MRPCVAPKNDPKSQKRLGNFQEKIVINGVGGEAAVKYFPFAPPAVRTLRNDCSPKPGSFRNGGATI